MAAARRLFVRTPQGPENTSLRLENQGQPPYQALASFIDSTDITYPPPGGGLLRVPVGGGQAAEMLGTLPGQLTFWKSSQGLWLPTPTAPTDRQIPVWDATAEEWVFTSDVTQLYRGRLFDSFLGGRVSALSAQNQAAGIGDLGWNFDTTGATAGLARVTGTGMAGAYSITANNGPIVAATLGPSTGAGGGFSIDGVNYVEFKGILDSAGGANGESRMGICSGALSSQMGQNAFFVASDPAISGGAVRAISRATSVSTTFVTAALAAQLHTYRFTRISATSWSFSLDGVVLTTFTAGQVPAAATLMVPAVVAQAAVGGAMATTIDNFDLFYTF